MYKYMSVYNIEPIPPNINTYIQFGILEYRRCEIIIKLTFIVKILHKYYARKQI